MSSTIHEIKINDGPAVIHRQPTIGDTFYGRVLSFVEDGATLDISGDSFSFQIKDENGAIITGCNLSIGSGIEIFDTKGIEWRIEDTVTANFTANANWTYRLKWTRADNGNVKTINAGSVIPRQYP